MSYSALDVIDKLPTELQARLEADAFFADIPVIVADKGNVKLEMERRQSAITEKGGRRGVAVIVLQLVTDDDYPEVTFGPHTLRPAFQIVENTELNNDERGTRKSCRRVARKIHQIIKPLVLHGYATVFTADSPAIEPVNLASELGDKLVAMQANFVTHEFDTEQLSQVATPEFAAGSGDVPELVMTCATEDAEIWYSTDGSYPAPNRPGSIQYATPIAIPLAGFTVRACAYKADMVASEVFRAAISYE
jgi:hypothetical protein